MISVLKDTSETYTLSSFYDLITPVQYKVIVVAALASVALADPDGGHGYGGGHGGGYGGGYGHNAHPNYNFDYAVKADYGGNFGHQEYRDGYDAKGSYYVYLPDGRLQTVNYYTDKWGYHADVDYKGKAKHPSYYGPAVTFKHDGGYH
ncbi:uncharacterized protein LOC143035700 [Oratosquilla oratoria]|uniref:uncharacterized protein LOC143035700 n=1 Tax=Oratosquilla oratoria TaxID=337810 RepID=UPI003F764332